MVFQSKMTPFKRWVEPARVQNYVNFFGPGVDAEVGKKKERISACWRAASFRRGRTEPPRTIV